MHHSFVVIQGAVYAKQKQNLAPMDNGYVLLLHAMCTSANLIILLSDLSQQSVCKEDKNWVKAIPLLPNLLDSWSQRLM